ncbi:c-type cytochrome [Ramlibacter sp. MMS24-I3-19]|uniref:c-type cytochrome n=1 Tax=Ramlibacter sp. MMS24-I3-19 TaxID=3416606 RepID=UPI003CFC6382
MRSKARFSALRIALGLAVGVLTAAAAHAAADPQLCVACHGPNGNSQNPAVPALAGQPAQFISTQLVMFREKRRVNEQMSPIAATLANADISALGKFFSTQQREAPAKKPADDVMASGKALTEKFNCVACHGAALKGQQHIPRLAGQQADYLRTQLRGFKAGTRFDMDGNMTAAAQPLGEPDIDVLAQYLSALE